MLPTVNLRITLNLVGDFYMKICPNPCEISCKNTTYEIGLRKATTTNLKLTLVK